MTTTKKICYGELGNTVINFGTVYKGKLYKNVISFSVSNKILTYIYGLKLMMEIKRKFNEDIIKFLLYYDTVKNTPYSKYNLRNTVKFDENEFDYDEVYKWLYDQLNDNCINQQDTLINIPFVF